MESEYTFSNFTELSDDELVLVFNWRNHYEIRKWMYNIDLVDLDKHYAFVENLKNEKSKLYFLVKRNNLPVGTFSLTGIENNEAEWGYYVSPDYHNKNIAVEFYYYVLKFIYTILRIKNVIGYVLIENRSANSLSDFFGFSKNISTELHNDTGIGNYLFREMSENVWQEKVLSNKKIKRLLQLTMNESL